MDNNYDNQYRDSAYTQRLEKIEAVLQAWLPENPDPKGAAKNWMTQVFSGIDDPIAPDLVQSLTQPGWDLFNRGGKRWRPLLMTLICETLGGEDRALALTPLLEFPHTASLIHDDIEDNADERRGGPAIHIRYGTDTAINGGAFLYFLPLACINAWDASAEQKNRIFDFWGAYMRRLHLGQAMDIRWHRDFASLPSLEAYKLMCRLKTGSLARLAAVLGVAAAQLKADVLPAHESFLFNTLGQAAENVGIGFQILDDVKNLTTGNPGKKRGDDVVEGKKSLPVLLYLYHHPEGRELVIRCFIAARERESRVDAVEELIEALTLDGVLTEASEQGCSLIRDAREVFSHIPGVDPVLGGSGALLGGLLDFIGGSSMSRIPAYV
ncbi:MAG: polyprenyl synthetase family protein [Treponema sp.]|jgi:octaprenyl-diphosphate synthase|nr:polyprenyl synthetase family protein [Treponema sp.]